MGQCQIFKADMISVRYDYLLVRAVFQIRRYSPAKK